jgi:hypothetical protein
MAEMEWRPFADEGALCGKKATRHDGGLEDGRGQVMVMVMEWERGEIAAK